MPIKIIKRAEAPKLREEPIFVEPVCNYVQAHLPGKGLEDLEGIPKLYKCTVCGEYCKQPYWEGKPIKDCPLWQHHEARKVKEKRT